MIQKYSDLPALAGWKPTRWKISRVLRHLVRRPTWRPLLPGSMRTAEYMLFHNLLVRHVGRSGHAEYEITDKGAAFGYYFLMEEEIYGDYVDGQGDSGPRS